MDPTYFPLVAAACTVVGALAGAITGARIARGTAFKTVVRHEFIKAAAVFKYLLEEDLERLKTLPANEDFFVAMQNRFDSYERAMIGLKINLPSKMISSFEQTWDKYKYAGHESEKYNLKYSQLYAFHLSDGNEKAKQRTIDNIKKLQNFCDPDFVFE